MLQSYIFILLKPIFVEIEREKELAPFSFDPRCTFAKYLQLAGFDNFMLPNKI